MSNIISTVDQMPTIGVVIPVYNRALLALETLESVRKQTVQPDKVIVVDDGSTDDSYQCIDLWLLEHGLDRNQWVLIRQKNKGLSGARNSARSEVAELDLVVFLDSDDLWPEDFIHRAKKFFDINKAFLAASTDGEKLYFDRSGVVERREFLPITACSDSFEMLKKRAPLVCATVFKKDALDRVGWFDDSIKYAEDHLLWHLVASMGDWGHIDGKPFQYRYFQNPDQPHNSAIPHLLSRVRCAHQLNVRLSGLCSRQRLKQKNIRWAIWKTWYSGARACQKSGKLRAACVLYYRAFKAYPLEPKSLLRLIWLQSYYWSKKHFLNN